MADIFLGTNEILTGVPASFSGSRFFGNTGGESVGLDFGAANITIAQTVEQVRLPGSSSDYTYLQAGNQLKIYIGATLVATITAQADADGTLLQFSNGTTSLKVSSAGMTIGDSLVSSVTAGPVVPINIGPPPVGSGETFNLTTGVDVRTGTALNDTFNAFVDTTGGPTSTFTTQDNLNGGAGVDTFNIFSVGGANFAFPAFATVQNFEIVNLYSTAGVDASLRNAANFQGVEQLWQIGIAGDVTGLGATTAAGFRNVASLNVSVEPATTGGAVTIALDNSTGTLTTTSNNVTVVGTKAAGTFTLDADATGALVVNTAVATTIDEAGSVTSVDASASAGAITISVADLAVSTGSGSDSVTVTGALTKAVSTGAGNDTVTIGANIGAGSIDGGAGTDTIKMTAELAETVSANATFEGKISNFEKLSLTSVSGATGRTINLANIDDIDYVIIDGASSGTAETAQITFTALTAGQSITVAGRTVTAYGGVTAVEVADAFETGTSTADLTVTGTLAGYTVSLGGTDTRTFTSIATGNVTDLDPTVGFNAAPTAPTPTTTQGVAAVAAATEVVTLTFGGVNNGNSPLNVGGVILNASSNVSGNDIAAYFLTGVVPANITVSGAVTLGQLSSLWNIGGSAASVTFTSLTPLTNVSDLEYSHVNITTNSYVQGSPGSAGVTETSSVTFGALSTGQSVTVDGKTVTAKVSVTAAQVAAAVASGSTDGNFLVTGALANWTAVATGSSVTFTSTTPDSNVADLTVTTAGAVAAPTDPTPVVVDGAEAPLVLNYAASGGTLEINGDVNATVDVNLPNATEVLSTNDVFNIRLAKATSIGGLGVVDLAGVETVNVTTDRGTALATTNVVHTLNLVDAAAKTITAAGNAGLTLTFTGTALTTFDASGITKGAVTWTSAALANAATIKGGNDGNTIDFSLATKAVAFTGGAGVDVVWTGNGVDTVSLGAGNDIVYSSLGGDTISLGAGNDVYTLTDIGHSVLGTGTFDTITDFSAKTATAAGDQIDLSGVLVATGISVFVASNASDATTFVATNGLNTTTAGIALNSATGRLYIDVNSDGVVDSVIDLLGLTSITSAAFIV